MRYFPQKLELSPNILSAAVDTPAQENYTMNWAVTNPAPQDTAAGTLTSKTQTKQTNQARFQNVCSGLCRPDLQNQVVSIP